MANPTTLTQPDPDSRNQPETRSGDVEGSNSPIPPIEGSVLSSLETNGRYRILGELGRGGMGVVYQATDSFLRREIAIKVLRDTGSVHGLTYRFVDEAVVTSQLQHPGIPAIYDLGFADGHPFLTMKLIKGETLTNKLKSISVPSDRGELIAAFELVCQAVAYAHERRIIHRDLKPSNIMIGAFGEVQVMDWGLAKKLIPNSVPGPTSISKDQEAPTEIRTTRGNDGDGTSPGSVLGTAAFTPPEQAGGEIEKMDERVDVFGLGAVLCTILTGHPPYVAETGEAVRVMAVRGDTEGAFARLDRCEADPELVHLCRQCLNRDLNHRPRNAKVVADAVAAYRTGVERRLLAADQAAAVTAAKATEQRKRQRVQLALAASLVVLVVAVSSAVLWNQKQHAKRLVEAETNANVALNKAETLAAQAAILEIESVAHAEVGVGLWREALTAAEHAEGIVPPTLDPNLSAQVEARVAAIRDGLTRAQTTLIRAQRDHALFVAIEKAHGMSADHYRAKKDTYAAKAFADAFQVAGLPAGGSPESFATAIQAERPAIRAAILTSIDHWAWCLESNEEAARIRKAADLADGDPFRRDVRSAIGTKNTAALLRLANQQESSNLPPVTATLLGRALDDCHEHKAAARVLLAARDRNPGDYWLLIELAHALWELPQGEKPGRDEAITCLRAALAVRQDNAKTHNRLGRCLDDQGERKLAEACYRRAIALDSALAEAWNNLGFVQDRRDEFAAAEASYNTAIRCDPDFAMAYTNLGFLLLRKGDIVKAEEALRKALERDSRDPIAHINLGVVRERQGNILGAIAAYQQAILCDETFALAYSNRGESQRWLADWAGAEVSFRKALQLDPGLTLARKNLGWLLYLRGDLPTAEAFFIKALESNMNDAESLGILGCILERKGDLNAAEYHYTRAARIDPGGDDAHAFQANRLKSHPTTPGELKRILDQTLSEHHEWSARQRRAARSAAAISAIWYARADAPGVALRDRTGFRYLARELFADLLTELSESLAVSREPTAAEMISLTANWLGDVELARVRNLFSLIALPAAEAEEWTKVWAKVHTVREKCLKPPSQ